ncbi:hypothetical protein CGQ24_11930 [Arthrobacter sp. 7749]|nr:hypothetical protein CGQ24_11930 [Arthrobacter sp. 7749]
MRSVVYEVVIFSVYDAATLHTYAERPNRVGIFASLNDSTEHSFGTRDFGAHPSDMRVEPWSFVFTDLSTGTILDVVDGRRGKAVTTWIDQCPASWKRSIEYLAMDMSAEFRKAIRDSLP